MRSAGFSSRDLAAAISLGSHPVRGLGEPAEMFGLP